MSLVPRIHEAFADLDEPERVSTTSIPPIEAEANATDQDRLSDDDWLQDDRISAAPAGGRKNAFGGSANSGNTEDVDFVDMMSSANDDDDDVDGG